jgi:hypothetical protein
VPGRHEIGTNAQRRIQENIKLDFTVAKYVRIRGPAALILGKHVIDDSFFVFFAEINGLKRNAQMLCDNHCIVTVVQPGAFVADGDTVIVPVFHEHPNHFIPLLL